MTELDQRTACECCKGVGRLVPVGHVNRPGLDEVRFRVGTHAGFRSTMLAEISRKETLRHLGRRTNDDFTIALLDAWAVTLDVLTFYQERIVNETFLRTAVERRSLLELARLIGYELRPGLAAGTLLAFTLDAAAGSPPEVTIPAGTAAQSIPTKEEVPQTFETSLDLLARPSLNRIRPRLTYTQSFTADTRRFFVKGTAANLKPGDPVLLVTGADGGTHQLLRVQLVRPDPAKARTQVDLALEPPALEPPAPAPYMSLFDIDLGVLAKLNFGDLGTSLDQGVFPAKDIAGALKHGGHSVADITSFLADKRVPRPPPTTAGVPGLYALRATAAPFGHNAPRYDTTPVEWRAAVGPFPTSWESCPIDQDSQSDPLEEGVTAVDLDQEVKEIVVDDWLVLSSQAQGGRVYRVGSVVARSRADFGLSGRTSHVVVKTAPGTNPAPLADVSKYTIRDTVVLTVGERLALADLPIDTIDAGTMGLELEDIVPDLPVGRTLILRGIRTGDFGGVPGTEALTVDSVFQGLYTSVLLAKPITYGYRRDTVEILANVAEATHGESRAEVVGSGDAAQAFQVFRLRQSPLTYVSSAESPTGGLAALAVAVNGIRWKPVPSLYPLGPKDRGYAVRLDDDGRTELHFGDGIHGARLPTGTENVAAAYRSGLGSPGLVGADRIALLPRKPLGVREVTNPLPSSGAQDPQTRDEARRNAPLTVRTLDRIVSLADFEDFARSFSGIAKARADWVWEGARRLVHVTVAGPSGAAAAPTVLENLLATMEKARVPHLASRLTPFEGLVFSLVAWLRVDPDMDEKVVLGNAEAAVRSAFSFAAREFVQGVAVSELIAVLERAEGVLAVDLDALAYEVDDGGNSPDQFGLPAMPARFDQVAGVILPAQLLRVTDEPLDLRVMR